MKLIVGLGNPGDRYQGTRHNAGRLLVEFIARHYQLSFSKKKKLEVSVAFLEWEGVPVTLAYPETFMNLSGESVKRLVEHFGIPFRKDLLVVVDDFALPFGRLRLRSKGRDGGHKGLRSIHEALGSTGYPRLRLGIGDEPSLGHSPQEMLEDYVLSFFSVQEKEELEIFLQRGVEACRLWVTCPIEQAMNSVNGGQSKG